MYYRNYLIIDFIQSDFLRFEMEIERVEKFPPRFWFEKISFQIGLAPADQIKPEKSIGLTRKSSYIFMKPF